MFEHRSDLRQVIEPLGLSSPGHLLDLAEFLLEGEFEVGVARRRFIYDEPDNVGRLFDELEPRGLVDETNRASGDVVGVLRTVLQLRASAADQLWRSHLGTSTRGAAEALSAARGQLVDAFVRLPEPARAAHRLHHLLTGLRYARMDAHIDAWEAVGLAPNEIVALSASVEGQPASATRGVVERGWMADDGSITPAGRAARTEIEDATNNRCQAMFDGVTNLAEWVEGLRSLS